MLDLAFLNNMGPMELMIILVIALLVFGNRLPQVMRSLGSSVNEFKKGLNDVADASAQPAPATAPAAPVAEAPVQLAQASVPADHAPPVAKQMP